MKIRFRSVVVGTDYNTKKSRVWGEGRLEKLARMKEQLRVDALMLDVDMLTPLQQVGEICFGTGLWTEDVLLY